MILCRWNHTVGGFCRVTAATQQHAFKVPPCLAVAKSEFRKVFQQYFLVMGLYIKLVLKDIKFLCIFKSQ